MGLKKLECNPGSARKLYNRHSGSHDLLDKTFLLYWLLDKYCFLEKLQRWFSARVGLSLGSSFRW